MKFKEAIDSVSNWKNIFFLAIILLVIIGLILPEASQYLKECINGNRRLDMAFFYTPEEVYHCLEMYGAKGRQVYIFVLLTLDFIFPVFYTLFFCGIISILLKKHSLEKYYWAVYLPLLPFLCDLLENMSIAFMLFQFPLRFTIFIRLTAALNVIKWISLGLIIAVIIAGAAVLLFHFLKKAEQKIMANKSAHQADS
ncbi:MAG: hypothetical protein AAFZ15_10455 [Bacteroidota bacterium]